MFKSLKGYFVLFILSLLIYLGIYQVDEGLINIGITLLWIFTVMFCLLACIASESGMPKKKDRPKPVLYFNRLWGCSLVFALIYGGEIFMGVIWIFSIIIILAKEVKDNE